MFRVVYYGEEWQGKLYTSKEPLKSIKHAIWWHHNKSPQHYWCSAVVEQFDGCCWHYVKEL